MATIFIFAIGLVTLFFIGVYIADISQTKQAIKRNYPVIIDEGSAKKAFAARSFFNINGKSIMLEDLSSNTVQNN